MRTFLFPLISTLVLALILSPAASAQDESPTANQLRKAKDLCEELVQPETYPRWQLSTPSCKTDGQKMCTALRKTDGLSVTHTCPVPATSTSDGSSSSTGSGPRPLQQN